MGAKASEWKCEGDCAGEVVRDCVFDTSAASDTTAPLPIPSRRYKRPTSGPMRGCRTLFGIIAAVATVAALPDFSLASAVSPLTRLVPVVPGFPGYGSPLASAISPLTRPVPVVPGFPGYGSPLASVISPLTRPVPVVPGFPGCGSPLASAAGPRARPPDVSTSGAPLCDNAAGCVSPAHRAMLELLLPRPRPAAQVVSALAARRRRANRRGRLAVVKHANRPVGERYVLEPVAQPAPLAPKAGDFVPGAHAQGTVDEVVRAIEICAARGILSAAQLTEIVVAALSHQPSADLTPQRGRCEMPSRLSPDAILELALTDPAALPDGLTAQALADGARLGFDLLYRGPRRTDAVGNSVPPTELAAAQLQAEHDDDVRDGRVLDVTEIFSATPLAALIQCGRRQVPKRTDQQGNVTSYRPISDASGRDALVGSNAGIDPSPLSPVRVCTLREVGDALYGAVEAANGEVVEMATHDYAAAYRSLPISAQSVWHSCYSMHGRLYADLRVSFGSRSGGSYLCVLSHLVARRVEAEMGDPRVRVVCFVDDTAIIAPRGALMSRATALLRTWAARVGLVVQEDKTRAPAVRQRFLGIEWCSETMRTYLPADKLAKLSAELSDMCAQPTVTCRSLTALLSRCVWTAQCVPVIQSTLAPARALTRGLPPSARVTLTPLARDALAAAGEVLAATGGSTLVPRSVRTADTVTAVSDASSTGIGWLCETTRRYCSEPLPKDIADTHINLLELAAAGAAALDLHAQLVAQGRPPQAIALVTDNTVALACLSALSTNSTALTPLTHAIARFSDINSVLLAPSYVQSALNPADCLSRLEIPESFAGWTRVRYTSDRVRQLVEGDLRSFYPASTLPARH